MKWKHLVLSLISLLSIMSFVHGEEWAIRGARARGMGGAQVADPKGTLAAYWNPAAFAFREGIGHGATKGDGGLPVEILLADFNMDAVITGGLVKDAFDLRDIVNGIDGGISGLQGRLNSLTSVTSNDINSLMKLLDFLGRFSGNPNKGMYLNVSASGLDVRVGSFALTSQVYSYAGVNPSIQLTSNNIIGTNTNPFGTGNTLYGVAFDPATAIPSSNPVTASGTTLVQALVNGGNGKLTTDQAEAMLFFSEQQGINISDPNFQAAIISAVQNTGNAVATGTLDINNTGIILKGMLLAEVRGSAAFAIIPDKLAVGANLKIMQGVTFSRLIPLANINDLKSIFNETRDDLDKQTKESVQFSMDLGALLKIGMIQVGLTGRNIIPTEYKSSLGSNFKVDPQARAGVALAMGWITAAVDIDINPNRSFAFDKFDSQLISAGLEVVPVNFGLLSIALWAGISKNLSQATENEVYHLGFGVFIGVVKVEAAAAVDSKAIKSGNFSADFGKNREDIPDRVGYSITISVGFGF